ncbi:hypothetical protein B0I35DRAFT_409036 [Stachybotrys elegans]|uniref:Uncharacterized protein n=1 Tax=Stachybotrys elegans TaxID=80388 RepID=A0A8K0SLF3_9HYPO|nr:hypothetical protein B0I35DRAFT_409036 [Stachybotrys elegans]
MSSFQRDDELCRRYAQFASHMDRWQFKIIYWTMFVTNLIVLFLASYTYTKGQESLQKYGADDRKRRKSLRKYIFLCMACVCVSTVVVVMEAYALLALQFCDGEDLMSLYWSTWTMIQVGSLIAMVGIILALAHSLRDRQHPPWALALGTPVLVIAGFLHLFHDCTRKRVKSLKRRRNSGMSMDMPPFSQANTISGPVDEEDDRDTVRGEFIGLTVDGGPIIRFTCPPRGPLPATAILLGVSDDSKPIIAYSKNSVHFLGSSEGSSDLEAGKGPLKKQKDTD